MFSSRIVSVNHYLHAPIPDLDVVFSDFRNSKVTQVPVLRIFGSTPAGQKTCLHIHGVFPYFYVPCDETEVTDKLLQQLALSIDTALQVGSGNANKYMQHVFKITAVSGRQLYGYRSSERQFLKIYFYNPFVLRRAAELLQTGAVLNKVFQPFECHVPFNLQFFIDYNLYGMNLINLAAVKFRKLQTEKPSNTDLSNCGESQAEESLMCNSVSTQHWDPSNIPGSQWLPDDVKRQSTCELEVDGVAADILNRLDLKDNVDTNPGLVAIWEDERQRREQLNQLSELMPPSSPERGEIPPQESEFDWLERLREVVEDELKDLKVHLPTPEERKKPSQDEEESPSVPASQQSSNQFVDHLSQQPASQSLNEEVDPVIDEELASSFSQVSGGELSQALDKDLANLLMELGDDVVDPDSLLSTQTPAATQGEENSDEDEVANAEKQETFEMSQVWEKEEEDEVKSGDENLIPEMDETSAFSQPGDLSTQLSQLDGQNDPRPEQKKKSKLQMVQEFRAIKASHQLQKANPSSPSSMHSSDHHSLQIAMTEDVDSGVVDGSKPKLVAGNIAIESTSASAVGSMPDGVSQSGQPNKSRKGSQGVEERQVSISQQEGTEGTKTGNKSVARIKISSGNVDAAANIVSMGSSFKSKGIPKHTPKKRGRPPSNLTKMKANPKDDDLQENVQSGVDSTHGNDFKAVVFGGGLKIEQPKGGIKVTKKKGRPPSIGKQSGVNKINPDVESMSSSPADKLSSQKNDAVIHRLISAKNSLKVKGKKRLMTKRKQLDFESNSQHSSTENMSQSNTATSVGNNVGSKASLGKPMSTKKRGRPPKAKQSIHTDGAVCKVKSDSEEKSDSHRGQNRKKVSDNLEKKKTSDIGMGLEVQIDDSFKSQSKKVKPLTLKKGKVLFKNKKEEKTFFERVNNSQPSTSQNSSSYLSNTLYNRNAHSEDDVSPHKLVYKVKKKRGRPPLKFKQGGNDGKVNSNSPQFESIHSSQSTVIVSDDGGSPSASHASGSQSPKSAKKTKKKKKRKKKGKRRSEDDPNDNTITVSGSSSSDGPEVGSRDRLGSEDESLKTIIVKRQKDNKRDEQFYIQNTKVPSSMYPPHKSASAVTGLPSSTQHTVLKRRGRPPKKHKSIITSNQQDGHHLTPHQAFQRAHPVGLPRLKQVHVSLNKVSITGEQMDGSDSVDESTIVASASENCESESLSQTDRSLSGQPTFTSSPVTKRLEESMKDNRGVTNDSLEIKGTKKKRHKKHKTLGMRTKMVYQIGDKKWKKDTVKVKNRTPKLSQKALFSTSSVSDSSKLNMSDSQSVHSMTSDAENEPHEILISPAADDTRKETSLHVTPSCKLDGQDSVQNDGAAREAIFERGEDAIQIATAGNENIAKEITLHSKLVGGHSINLDEFPAEKLLTMSEISPKVILYRFGKCPSITAPATNSKQESSPVVGLGETSSVCNEALTALPRSSDTSPSLDCSLYQRKYLPANSKAAKLKKSTSTRMRKIVDYTRLAGLTKYYKGSRKLLTGKDAVVVEEEDSSKENTSEEVVDLTISSPEEEEQKTKSLESGSDDIIEGFSSSALNESSSTLTQGRRKSKLSKGSHKKAKRKAMSPSSSPINKPELAFLVTPPKIVRDNSKQSPLDSPPISNTPQADSSSPGKAVKRGRGRPRKLKLNEDDKKQRKKVKALSKKSPKIKGVEITFTAKKKIENHLSGKNALEMSIDKDGKSRGGQKSGGNGAFDQRDQSLLKSRDDKIPLVGEGDGSRILTSLGNLSSEEIKEKGAAQSEKSASMVSYEDEDGRYPFLKTPPGSPYRDALWNLAYPSPVFSLPKASPPKFWSPTEQSVENVPPPLAACPSLKTLKSNSKDELLSYVSQDTDRDISDGTSGSPPIDDWDSDQSNDHQSSPVEIGITPMELFEEVEEITSDAETGRNVSQEITSGSSVEQISSTEEEEDSRCKGTGDKVVNSTEHHQDGTREMEDVVQDDSKDLQVDGVLEKESHLEVATVEESSSQKQLSSYEHVDGDGDRDDIGKQEADNEKGSIQEIATNETVEGKDGLDPSKVGSDVDERDTQDIVGGGDCVHSDKDTQGVRSMQEDTAEGVANGNRNDSTVDCPGIISRKAYNSDAPGGDCKTTADPGRDGERVVDDDDDEGEPLIPYPMSIPDSATPVSSESEDESPLLGLLEGVSQGDFSSRDAVAVDERDEEEKTVDKENNVLPEQNASDRIPERNSGDKNALQEETHPSLNAGELSCPDQQTGGDGNQKSNHEAKTCDHEKHAVGDIQLSSNQVKESGDHREEISYPEKRAGDHMKQTSEDGSQILGIQNETPGRGELILDHSKEERNEGVQNGNELLEGNKGSEDRTGAKEDTKWQSREGENGGNVFIEEKRRSEERISAKECATEQGIEGEDGDVPLKENKGSEEGMDTKEAATEQKSEGVEKGNILSEDNKGLEERAGAKEKDAKTQRREEEDSSIPLEENKEFEDKRDVKEQHRKGEDNGNVLLEEKRRFEERTDVKEAATEQRSEGTENGIVLLAEKKGAEDRTGPKEQQCEGGEEGGSVPSEGNERSEQRMSPVIEFQGSDTQVKMLTSIGDSETSNKVIQNGSDSMSDRNEGVSVNVREAEYRESPNADCSQVEQDDGEVQEKQATDEPQQQSIKEIDSYGKHARGEEIGGKGEKRVIDSVSSMNVDNDTVDETTADRTSPVLPFQGTLSQAQSLQTGSSGEQNIQEVVILEQRAELVVKEQERDNTEAAIMREGGSPVFEFQGTLTQMSNLDQSSLYRDNESARAAAFISDPESSFDIESQAALQSEEIVGDGRATAESGAVVTGDPRSGIDQKERNPNQSKLTLGNNANRVVTDSVNRDRTIATFMVEESEDSSQSPEEPEISKLDRNKTDRDGEEAARDILIVGSISPFENVSQEASGSSSSGKSKSRGETGERRPALDFESTFMIEHSQFVLSDSGDNVNHQEIREGGYDPESSISLLESDVSDCDQRDDDVSDNEEKSPKGKAKAGRNCKGESKRKKKKNKKEKSRKRKREKSEKDSSETKKKKRKSTDLGDVGATKPRIKMTFRKVRASSSQPTGNGISSSALSSEGTNSEQDHSQIASQRGFFSQPDPKEKPSGSSNSKLRLLLTRPARLEGFTTMREYHKKQQLKHFELPTGHPEDVVEKVPTSPDVAREDKPENEHVKDDSHASGNVSKRAGKRRSFLKIGTLEKKDWRVGLDNKQRLEELQKLRLGQPPQPDDDVGKPSTPDSSLMHGKKGKTIRKSTSTSVPRRKRLNTMENEVIEALMDLSAKGGMGLLSHGNSQAETASTSRSLSRSPQGMLRNIDKSTTSNIPDAKTTEQQVTMETDQGVRKAKRAKIACHPDVNSEKEYMGKDDSVTRRMQDSNQPVAMVTKTDVRKAKKAKLALPDLSKDEEVIIIEEASPEPVSGKDKDGNVSDSVNIKTQDSNVGQGVFVPVRQPPTRREVRDSLTDYGLTDCRHRVPYWQKGADVPSFVRETANMQVQLNQNLPDGLKEALPPSSSLGLNHWRMLTFLKDQTELTQGERFSEEEGNVMMKTLIESAASKRDVVVTPTRSPPSSAEVTKWLQSSLKRPRPPPASKEPASEKNSKEDEVSPPDSEISPMSCDKSGDLLRSPTATVAGEDPPSPFLQDLIDDIEPSTPPPMSDTPPSPLSCQTPQTLPCHSTPMTTGRTKKLNQPIVTPILVTSSKKNASKLKRRVSLVDPVKETRPRVVTPAQASMATPLLKKGSFVSQLEGPSLKNTGGFKYSQSNLQDAKALHENQNLTLMSLELHVHTRGKLRPDPEFDPVRAIFFCVASENYGEGVGEGARSEHLGVITVDNPNKNQLQTQTSSRPALSTYGLPDIEVINMTDEARMIEELLKLVKKHDPDILVGFEIQQLSWGYLFDRATALEIKLCAKISRLPDNERESHFSSEKDAYGANHTSEVNIAGRIVLNIWRLLRHEIALNVYTFENVAYHVLHQRVPLFSLQDLSAWYDHQTHLLRWRVVEHYMYRVTGNLKILKKLDLIGRTSELARVFGIEFFSVLSRGSQYRVESMMLRQAKSQNFVAISPSVQQRAVMKAPECVALILEPESRLYEDPVIVLDFQSLYPSMMIGYNYCFSTCLGRVEHIAKGGEFVLGCTTHYIPPVQIKKLLDSGGLHVSPNGVVFVRKHVRHGILPRMLDQILKTRIMVKKGIKDHKDDKVLQRMLDNRQLGLKLIANVTYGYTSASFSGRMPCIEVGDSIVMKARETLERSIHLVENTPKWGAKVVYGDTDSMFVMVKGATKERAFQVGKEIVAAVSKVNPKPVKLKLEKVYKPCVLQAKKRYVGFKYESPDQVEPELEAKGIETIRRDTCPAVAKILEKALKIVFTTQNISQVKQYVQKQFQKIVDGRINLQELVFAKEYRGRQYYKPGACVPALELTKRSLSVDRRAEPRVGERVPYLIVNGVPGLPLIQLVRRPEEMVSDPSLIINSTYYITRQIIPALNRVFGIMGVETLQWFQELPRTVRVSMAPTNLKSNARKGTISQYFCSLNCAICDQLTKTGLCDDCRRQPQLASAVLNRRIQDHQRAWIHLTKICRSCSGFAEHEPSCISTDCPIRHQVAKTLRKMNSIPHLVQLIRDVPADGGQSGLLLL